ncbi:MAG: ABC transporter ATP-binding protein [Clostridia bacterium]
MEDALKVQNLSKKIGKKSIISNISFDVKYGETVGIVGINGAGKTSILKCLCGLWTKYEGKIFVNGFDFKDKPNECLFCMGTMIENPSLFPNMTLKQNIEYFGAFCTYDYQSRINLFLDFLKLDVFYNKKVRTFSTGMKQKACLLIVLMKKPSILLLDEPTSMLDPLSAEEIRIFLNYIKEKEKVSTLICSHNLVEIEDLCDKVIIIDKGKIIENIEINNNCTKLYKFEFANENIAKQTYKQSKEYETVLQGKNIFLRANVTNLKKYITEENPDFTNLSTDGNLQRIFSSLI